MKMVAIKDFGIPSCCVNCDMCSSDNPSLKDENRGYCHVTQKSITNIYDERPSDCPLVEIEERKVGKWIRKPIRNDKGGCIGAEMICSCCNKDNRHDEYMDYCPSCGSKMSDIPTGSD